MNHNKTDKSSSDNGNLSEWNKVKDGSFTNINSATSDFFVFENAEQQFPVWTIILIGVLLLLGSSTALYLLSKPSTPKPLINFDGHLPFITIQSQDSCNIQVIGQIEDKKENINNNFNAIFNVNNYASRNINYRASFSTPNYVESLLLGLQRHTDDLLSMNAIDRIYETGNSPPADMEVEELPIAEYIKIRPPAKIYPLIYSLKTPYTPLPQQLPEIILPMMDSIVVSPRSKFHIELTGGGLLSYSSYDPMSEAAELRNSHTASLFGFHYGIKIQQRLNRHLFMFTGLDQQVYYQDIDFIAERPAKFGPEGAIYDWQYSNDPTYREVVSALGDTTIAGMQVRRVTQRNKYRSTQLRSGLGLTLGNENWRLHPSIGVVFGVLDRAKGWNVTDDLSVLEYSTTDDIFEKLQLMSIAGIDIQRRLNDIFYLKLGYQYRQQWNNAAIGDGLDYKPGFHYLSVGVQMDL